mmetsp:Transcript_21217/g.49816  ORF Transcript_21217/g.49816 Transcript_21217/m.49816 type:complete len:117 (-) Transcript_21217:76-426(-)
MGLTVHLKVLTARLAARPRVLTQLKGLTARIQALTAGLKVLTARLKALTLGLRVGLMISFTTVNRAILSSGSQCLSLPLNQKPSGAIRINRRPCGRSCGRKGGSHFHPFVPVVNLN